MAKQRNNFVKLLGIDKSIRAAFRSGAAAKNVRKELLPKVDATYRESMRRRFSSNNNDRGVGGEWEPLSVGYGAWKRKLKGNIPTLVFTGALKTSFVKTGGMHVRRVTRGVIELGSRHRLAAEHNYGRNKLPARKLEGASSETRAAFERDVQRYVREFILTRVEKHLRNLEAGRAPASVNRALLNERLGVEG